MCLFEPNVFVAAQLYLPLWIFFSESAKGTKKEIKEKRHRGAKKREEKAAPKKKKRKEEEKNSEVLASFESLPKLYPLLA